MTTADRLWNRYRFVCPDPDCRPVIFPPPGPWWRSGFNSDDQAILIAYLPKGVDLLEFWPDAIDIEDPDECDGPVFTSRFARPDWYKGPGREAT